VTTGWVDAVRTGHRHVSGVARAVGNYFLALWFKPVSATGLAGSRIAFFGLAWYLLRRIDLAEWIPFQKVAWRPIGIFKLLGLPLASAPVLSMVSQVFWASLLCAALGLAYRVSAFTAAVTGLYYFGVGNNFGKVSHGTNLYVLGLFVFAMARAADKWSLDQLILRVWKSRGSSGGSSRTAALAEPPKSGEYYRPLRFVLLLVLVMYCSAGISKLRVSGWSWALSDSFERLLLRHHFTHSPPTTWGVEVARHGYFTQGLALSALLIELLCPLALFSKWAFRFFIPALLGLQLGIYLLIGVTFRPMLPVFACLAPWEKLWAISTSLVRGSRQLVGRWSAALRSD
jgi:hypothetical protein